MGNCKYCGQSAGLLRSEHRECKEKHEQEVRLIESGKSRITQEVIRAIENNDSYDALNDNILRVERASGLSSGDRKWLLIDGWEKAINKFLDDGVIDDREEKRLLEFCDYFELSKDDIQQCAGYEMFVKGMVLRELMSGIVPDRMIINGALPVNLQKGEKVIWFFKNTDYLEDKTKRQYVGGSSGVSVRIMQGVYYRVGAFKGSPVESMERVYVDKGYLIITNKHVYFSGQNKSFRVPFAKIVSFTPYSDGIGLVKEAANPKMQSFVTGDGWFCYNLVVNASRL
ncbi:MAG: hypothetical protein HGB04_03855 [Chlorobiaceae bacterium]|nr:hypothetical protein [Chlorobiaceae bacterium]